MSTDTITWILFFINGIQFYYIMCAFFRPRIKNLWLGATIYSVICMLMNYAARLFEGNLYHLAATIIIVLQVVILYPLFDIRKKYMAWVIEFFVMGVMFVVQIPAISLAEVITGTNILAELNSSNYDLSYVIGMSLTCMLCMLFLIGVHVIQFVRRFTASKWIFVIALGLVVYQTCLITIFYMLCGENSNNAMNGGVLFVVFSVISDIAVLTGVEYFLEENEMEKERNILWVQRQKEYEHYLTFQNEMEQIRLQRHESVNYLQAIELLVVEEENVSDIKRLIRKMQNMYGGILEDETVEDTERV